MSLTNLFLTDDQVATCESYQCYRWSSATDTCEFDLLCNQPYYQSRAVWIILAIIGALLIAAIIYVIRCCSKSDQKSRADARQLPAEALKSSLSQRPDLLNI